MGLIDITKKWFKHGSENTAMPNQTSQIELIGINSQVPIVKQTSDSSYVEKHKAKHKAKRLIKTKFIIGGIYYQRIKPRDGSQQVLTGYECKKYIYSMNDIQMNIVIMKQISGPEGKKFTLDRHECLQFHIKWEPGLEVWPMGINWIPEKKLQKN